MKLIFLMFMSIGILNAGFSKSGDIVTDSTNKLQWQDDSIGSATTWNKAISRCESLALGGYSDWRLPNVNELKSIVDRSKSAPAIVNVFTNTYSKSYWSASTYKGSNTQAWNIVFEFGYTYRFPKSYTFHVRCVRDGQ